MPRTSRTLGDLETMLLLRRVPLFEGLDPEDLQRVATSAEEHLYPTDDVLVREGDLSDSLVVIVEGSVRVVHVDPDGTERLVRRYESGDHIGELAALREAPRAATVIAEGDGVRGPRHRGRCPQGDPARAPDAAMAMLATLAERITPSSGRTMHDGAPAATRPADRHGDVPADRRRRLDGPGPPAGRRVGRGQRRPPRPHPRCRGATTAASRSAPRATRCSRPFPRRRPGRRAAIDAQRALAGRDWPDDVSVRVRMGLHSGEAHLAGDDYGGFDVNRAARVAAVGHGGQIVLSGPTRALVESSLPGRRQPAEPWPSPAQGRPTAGAAVPARGPRAPHRFPAAARGGFVRRQPAGPPDQLHRAGPGPRGTRRPSRHGPPDHPHWARRHRQDEPGGRARTPASGRHARWSLVRRARCDRRREPGGSGRRPDARASSMGPSARRPTRCPASSPTGRMLLVLDNFEHVLDASGIVSMLLRSSPGSRFIVASRSPLHLGGEQEYPVHPLVTADEPGPGRRHVGGPPVHRTGAGRADRLGSGRGRLGHRGDLRAPGRATPRHRVRGRPDVAPASRPPSAIDLAARLPLPGSGPRDAPARQRTLAGAIAWSHELLGPEERHLLHDLAAFQDRFRPRTGRNGSCARTTPTAGRGQTSWSGSSRWRTRA